MANNTRKDILYQLDKCASEFIFPMLDNGYIYLAGTKMTLLREDVKWIIMIEIIGFSYRAGGHYGITNCIHLYGNCLDFEPGTNNENYIILTEDSQDGLTFDEDEKFYLNSTTDTFLLRGELHKICHNRNEYEKIGIELENSEHISAFEFLRYLTHNISEKLWATEEEIRARIPKYISKIMELNEWFHPDLVNGDLPSDNQTFQQLADVLETGNLELYKPTFQPNTHWKNWAEGGTL